MGASGPAAKLRSKLSLGKTADKASAVRLELSNGCYSWVSCISRMVSIRSWVSGSAAAAGGANFHVFLNSVEVGR